MIGRLCTFLFITASFAITAGAQVSKEPTLISAPKPVYPREAKDAGIGGRITVRVTVSESGEVLSIDDATGPTQLCNGSKDDPRLIALRNSVVDAIKHAKFSPAMKEGKPVKMTFWVNRFFDPVEERPLPLPPGERTIIKIQTVTGKARSLPKPDYPSAARASRASGAVTVRVLIDEPGDVFTAEAISGHPLLRSAAVTVACKAKFSPTEIDGKAVRVSGLITYVFFPGR
jgi:TonB family protein